MYLNKHRWQHSGMDGIIIHKHMHIISVLPKSELTDYTPEARNRAARANRRWRDFEPPAIHLLSFASTV